MYKEHCANVSKIDFSIKELEKTIKYSLKTNNEPAVRLHTNIHTFLTGAWIEVSLYKLLYEHQFSADDRYLILTKNTISLEQKWVNAINLAFAKAFAINIIKLGLDSETIKIKLARTHQSRYQDLLNFINNDINQVINIRNKIAHGQWHYTFNNDVTELQTEMQKQIHSNNYFKSKERLETIKVIIEMIRTISISPKTFEKDFDYLYSKIQMIKSRYTKNKYSENVKILKAKFSRAQEWREKNQTTPNIL